ncbi:MAG: hypothetical protein AAF550_03145 [Myxococcota bacterium]
MDQTGIEHSSAERMNDPHVNENHLGSDRRVHRVFVTQNTEYHLRHRTCVGVRNRHTGRWVEGHQALSAEVSGALKIGPQGSLKPRRSLPKIGESLFFSDGGRDMVTGAVVAVKRPPVDLVSTYGVRSRA